MASLVIQNGIVVPMDGGRTVHSPGWVWNDGDRIRGVGSGKPPCANPAVRVVDATEMLVLPGLVNAHTHLEQTFMRGIGADRHLRAWLDAIRPFQNTMSSDEKYLACMLGLVENIRSG